MTPLGSWGSSISLRAPTRHHDTEQGDLKCSEPGAIDAAIGASS